MGPSPPPSPLPHFRPSSASSSLPQLADNWFLHSSDRDTQILTHALTRELSSCSRGRPASSSAFPSPASFSSWESQSSEALSLVKALQQQQQQNLHHHQQQLQQKAAAMSSPRLGGDRFQQYPLQKGSPLSSNSETPASPFSTSSQHHDSPDGLFARSMANDCSLSSKASSIALSSQASVGAGGSKVNKRRSRASNKAPIAVLSADTSNFRAMVQQLTGIPSSSSIHSYTHSGIPLLKPQPIRQSFTSNSTPNLPTLDTSACFLGPKYVKEGVSFVHQLSSSPANLNPFSGARMQGRNVENNTLQSDSPFSGVDLSRMQGQNVENNTLQSDSPFSGVDLTRMQGRIVENNALQSHSPFAKQSVFNEQSNLINYSLSSSSPSLAGLWSSADSLKPRGKFPSFYEGEQMSVRQNPIPPTLAASDSFPMEEHVALKSTFNAVDSWLSFDGALANHAPNMELARMA